MKTEQNVLSMRNAEADMIADRYSEYKEMRNHALYLGCKRCKDCYSDSFATWNMRVIRRDMYERNALLFFYRY